MGGLVFCHHRPWRIVALNHLDCLIMVGLGLMASWGFTYIPKEEETHHVNNAIVFVLCAILLLIVASLVAFVLGEFGCVFEMLVHLGLQKKSSKLEVQM